MSILQKLFQCLATGKKKLYQIFCLKKGENYTHLSKQSLKHYCLLVKKVENPSLDSTLFNRNTINLNCFYIAILHCNYMVELFN